MVFLGKLLGYECYGIEVNKDMAVRLLRGVRYLGCADALRKICGIFDMIGVRWNMFACVVR